MRRFPLTTLLLLACSTLPVIPIATAGPTPVGIPADLARDQGVPQPGEGPFPYVIVTSRGLRTEFMTLARERIRNGIPSRVRSIESLRADYPVAVDDAERVRFFLRDAHQHWATRWVLLGGDTDVVPARFARLRGTLPERDIVSDWYYACLDGSWNADGDGFFGELPEDEVDVVPELTVGRAPVSGHQEARDFVRKTLAYEQRPADDAFDGSTLVFANRLSSVIFDFAFVAEQILPLIADDPAQQVTRLYETFDNPAWVPGALPETRQSVIDALNTGHNMVVGCGAGSPALLAAGSEVDGQYLTVADGLGLANGDRAGHVWLFTSQVGAFDAPTSLAEAFLRAPGGGAVTVIAPSDLSFIGTGTLLTRRFVEAVFEEGVSTIGEALGRARARHLETVGEVSTALSYQLLGDPLLRVLRQPPVATGSAPAGRGELEVTGLGQVRSDLAATIALPSTSRMSAAPIDRPRAGAGLTLSAPFPSPAVSSVRVECAAPGGGAPGAVDAVVLDLAGRAVRSLDLEAGRNGPAWQWDLRDASGRRVSPGVYFMRVRMGDASRTARLVVAAGR